MRQILSITRKELESYFGSPMALIFLGAFLAGTLFTFFWVDTFFARGIADVRPLFRWMPLLLIFLVAALTMRQWSEEQRAGTLEMLLTLPVTTTQMVLGKFLAVMAMVVLALLLTLPLPITVAQLGNLDWGPVFGGYLAAILLAGAYTAIGLFVSSRTDNQIVALIATGLVGGVFYLVGSSAAVDFVSNQVGELMRALGTGSRFESIERGVIDLRDLAYYLSLTGIFLVLNKLSLDSKRWSHGARTRPYRRRQAALSGLLIANLVLVNFWLYPLHGLRLDTTEYREYSLSQTTQDLLSNLQEPLLIRAYISSRTHPLLAPLVPRISDMLKEYEIAARGRVTAEVVDPTTDPEIEAEANQTYGIRPTPFQVSGRYEASVINSYFDILIRYGDQSVTLGFNDLIQVEPNRDGTIDVRLRNLEYDLTSAIKKVVYGFQSVDALLAAMSEPVHLTLIVTPNTLPADLAEAPATIQKVAEAIAAESDGKFTFEQIDPDAADSKMSRQELLDTYGLQPFPVSFFSDQSYYLHMLLQMGNRQQVIYPTGSLSEADIRTAIESALKRSAPGFLKVVGLWTPPATPTTDMFGQPQQPLASWNMIQEQLSSEYTVKPVNLSDGQVPEDIDMLLVIAPQNMNDKERFAVDQYLMRGGAVVVAAGNYTIAPDMLTGGLGVTKVENGLREMLQSYGVDVQEAMVLDPQNEPFPVAVNRTVGGFQVREIQALSYPFFVDVRPDGMARDNPMVSNLPAVTMNWVSPVVVDETKLAEHDVTVLLQSSPASWLRTDTNIQPDFEAYPEYGFAVEGEQKSYPLAVAVQGTFTSYFKDKPSPWEASNEEGDSGTTTSQDQPPATFLDQSPETARLVVIGSAEFVDDLVLNLSAQLTQDRFRNNLLFLQNAVDWSVEDLDLLSIRARGNNVRILKPLTEREQSMWEIANYGVALLALLVVGGIWQWRRRHEKPIPLGSPTSFGDLGVESGG
ncbi:Gldg family protein [Litorilinea aerophila]|uniref:ABC transporter permease subunit n=1 Tax=Litorilinea aerophila TaxID=1204385 RepID=A0A540VEK9_9CHLR|nr:Gldg family protein [Litorilinea aerophila]MCC9077135.1 Gldg family protein [Litorilinea aerophila]